MRFCGVVDAAVEEEAVKLRFGQVVGAFLFKGVLGGEYHEGRGERQGFAFDGDLPLLHDFEQRRLGFGRGAVDFVGEQQVGEDRAAAEFEAAFAGVVDHAAGDVGGQQVGGELDALELAVDGFGEAFDKQGFAQSRHAFDEDVAAAEQRDQRFFDDLFLSDDDALYGFAQGGSGGAEFFQGCIHIVLLSRAMAVMYAVNSGSSDGTCAVSRVSMVAALMPLLSARSASCAARSG